MFYCGFGLETLIISFVIPNNYTGFVVNTILIHSVTNGDCVFCNLSHGSSGSEHLNAADSSEVDAVVEPITGFTFQRVSFRKDRGNSDTASKDSSDQGGWMSCLSFLQHRRESVLRSDKSFFTLKYFNIFNSRNVS